MLEGLDSIDWAKLWHLRGTSEEIPKMLSNLEQAMKRGTSAQEWRPLAEEILHLVDPDNVNVVTEVTPYIIQFWIQLIKFGEQTHDVHYLLRDIAGMLSGAPAHDHYGDELREKFEAHGRSYDEEIHLGPTYARRAHEVASQHLDYFVSLVEHSAARSRGGATRVLSNFPEHAPRLLPILQHHISLEPDERVKDEVVMGISRLFGAYEHWTIVQKDNYRAFFREIIRTEGARAISHYFPPTAGFFAALALINDMRELAPIEAVDVLQQICINDDSAWALIEVCEELENIGAERGIPVLLKILKDSNGRDRDIMAEVVKALLDLSFGRTEYDIWWAISFPPDFISWHSFDIRIQEAEISPILHLTLQQESVIQAIIEAENIWVYKTDLFKWYGLPSTRETLRDLIANSDNNVD